MVIITMNKVHHMVCDVCKKKMSFMRSVDGTKVFLFCDNPSHEEFVFDLVFAEPSGMELLEKDGE